MIIRANDKEIQVKSILGDFIKRGAKTYPALRFEFDNEATASDIEVLLSGSFEILDDNREVMGVHEGYNTLKSINVIIGKLTTAEEEIAALESELAALKAENAANKSAIEILEAENAELLFNDITNVEYNEVSEEDTSAE